MPHDEKQLVLSIGNDVESSEHVGVFAWHDAASALKERRNGTLFFELINNSATFYTLSLKIYEKGNQLFLQHLYQEKGHADIKHKL